MSLRSSHQLLLAVRRCRNEYGRRGFSIAAPEVWNKLSCVVRLSESSQFFRKRLKTFLFATAFHNDNILGQALLLHHGFMTVNLTPL
jgi:hypothetical protein